MVTHQLANPWVVSGSPVCLSMKERNMAWTTPVVVELCLGMEVTSYESAEF